jgi:hypothetical protein
MMEQIVAIVFQDDLPWSVVTEDGSIFDVEMCKADGTLYYDRAGNYGIDGDSVYLEGGRTNDFWLDNRFQIKVNPGDGMGNRLESVDPRWLGGLESWGCESDTVYCKICDDHIPTDDVCEDACDHIHWDADKGWWAGEGCDEG